MKRRIFFKHSGGGLAAGIAFAPFPTHAQAG
jgi:hypothetical protein